jgi:hypothetical protein
MKKCTLFFVCMLCLWGHSVAAQEETHCLIKGIIGPKLGLKPEFSILVNSSYLTY